MDHLSICGCGEILMKSNNGTTRLRSKILIFKSGKAYAVCKKCGLELSVPVSLNERDLLSNTRNPKLWVSGVSK